MLTLNEAVDKVSHIQSRFRIGEEDISQYGSIDYGEMQGLFQLVSDPEKFGVAPMQTVVEIGSCIGRTACIVGLVLAQRGGELRGIEINPEFAQLARSHVQGLNLQDTVTIINGDSAQVSWDGSPIDLLIIDGDHSEEAVDKDCALWLPRLRPGGVVAFHDFEDFKPNNSVVLGAWDHLKGWVRLMSAMMLCVYRKPE